MTVLQLPIPAPTSSAENDNYGTSSDNSSSPTVRKTPSPVRSVSSNTNLSTTPLTSNVNSGSTAFFHSRAAATAASNAATNYVGGGGLGSLTLPLVGSNTTMMHQNQQQQSTLSQQRPISFLQLTSSSQMQQQPTTAYTSKNYTQQIHRNQNASSSATGRVYGTSNTMIPQQQQQQQYLGKINNSNVIMQRGKIPQNNNGLMSTSNMNNINTMNNPWMGNNNAMMQQQIPQNNNNLLGPVTVGGGGPNLNRRMSITQHQQQTRGGDRTKNRVANNNNNNNNTQQPSGRGGNRNNRMGVIAIDQQQHGRGGRIPRVAQSRPPLLPMASPSPALPNKDPQYIQQQQQQHRGTISMRGNNSNMGVVRADTTTTTAVSNPNAIVNFEEYNHHGSDGDFGIVVNNEDPGAFLSNCVPEVALSTGLVTLSVHEALTFDGVEIALHPDVFTNSSKTKGVDGKENGVKLRPGDLVEIRVWTARPGMEAETTSPQSKHGSSVMKSKINPGLTRPSLHSRNTSLATVSSSLTNTSLMNTPRTTLGVKQIITGQPPPLPKVIGGENIATSIGGSPTSTTSEAGRLFGENLVGSCSESVDGWSGVLHGENLLATPVPSQQQQQQQIPAAMASNLSSVFSGAASSLFRKMSASQHGETTSEDSPSAISANTHSRDNSTVTSAMHSRESSLITNSASWMSSLNNGSRDADTPPQISPSLTLNLESVAEGLPQQPHPLLMSMTSPDDSREQLALPMRRDSSSLVTSSATTPSPPHPLAQSSSTGPSILDTATTENSTPSSSQPSSPKPSPKNQLLASTPTSTPPTSIARTNAMSISGKPPVSASHRPPISNTTSSKSNGILSPESAREKSLLPSTILTPDVTSANSRQRASTDDAQFSRSESLPNNDMTPVPTHHRRYRSNIPAIKQVDSMPLSVVGSTMSNEQYNNNSDAVNNINDILQRTHFVKMAFVLPVSEGSLTSIKSSARTRVSLLRQVADLYNITAYDTVTVTQITRSKEPFVRQSISADFLTITFKDQFVSRGDMYTFQKSFLNSWVYEGKRLSFNGIRTNTKVIRHGDHVVRSGLITEDTKLTFRSRSARIIWLVQMSSEMWEQACPYEAVGHQTSHESSCKLYWDKFIEFATRLFDKWKKLGLTHSLTVVFFSRTYIRHPEGERRSSSVHIDSDGRMFEDHYKIVLENETAADDELIHRMKREFVRYPKGVKWNLSLGSERTPSTASQGNVLEAINITLNLLQLHYIDRDLQRTGNSIVIITPGNGVFEINKDLAGITKQRMMDNGIGSDMLSLGLPPLHVAPFFLYKDRGASSIEEEQGFDDWKTYFELPHWMNLSFVDYDNEEGPILYKDRLNDDDTFVDVSNTDAEDERDTQTWSASNGFLKRGNVDSFVAPKIQPVPFDPSRQRYKHLISDRGFEDILQSCRPRNRGEYGSGLPVSLTSLLQKVVVSDSNNETDANLKKASLNRASQQLASNDMGCLSPRRERNASRQGYLEWGAVDFDDLPNKRLSYPQEALRRSFSGSQSSPSSSIGGSYKFPSHLLSISHLQSTASLEGGGQSLSSGHRSDSSMATSDNEDAQSGIESPSMDKIQKLMAEFDKSTFSSTPKARTKEGDISKSIREDGLRTSINEPRPGSPTMFEGRVMLRSQSAMFPTAVSKGGGIEAALNQYDGTRQKKEKKSPRASILEYQVQEDAAAGRTSSSLAISPLSLGMHLSLDRRNEGLRPSVLRLVAPDAIPRSSRVDNAGDRFIPLESTSQRKHSFHLTQKAARSSRDMSYNPIKAPGQSSSNERRLVERHASHNEGHRGVKQMNENGDDDPHRNTEVELSKQRSKSKKHHQKTHQQSYRNRHKRWVLNPFRQEDEDEVLAKRTHNRRRWSHVFPLGEDEFKRHAGPNWKSLCQPAILPMTIDFYPTPQDLNDQKKFSVKQYSVTLPPLDETTYKDHTELLDDLLIQRMRQDFQIVPRTIIQQSSTRRDVTTENTLEATLSMGHKIQKLSYNQPNDSVDVVQYYARFAEDETPQTYRYMLWSALRQDYVSVFQPFTKYTRPYKWNELDMLISGDTVTTILEGMRYPRISFVILPDQFVDSQGEKEFVDKFLRLVEYFGKVQGLEKDELKNYSIEMHTNNDAHPQASSGDKHFVVDLRKKKDDKYEWMELVHDSNCDTRRTFRITIRWLVAVASKIDQQAQRLHSRCKREGLTLISVPNFSCLRSCFLNPFAVPLMKPIRDKNCVDTIEKALIDDFNFVYDGNHMSDPNEIDCLDGFDFERNKYSIKKKKKAVPARQYLHRTGTLFMRLLRDTRGRAIIITYLNQRHIAGDDEQLNHARAIFYSIEQCIAEVCKKAGFKPE